MRVFMAARLYHRLEPSSKIYEIVGEDIVELVERARVGSVMIAMKQFERLLIVHLPLLQLHSKPHIGTLHGLPEARRKLGVQGALSGCCCTTGSAC
jgi:hypothetical protein